MREQDGRLFAKIVLIELLVFYIDMESRVGQWVAI